MTNEATAEDATGGLTGGCLCHATRYRVTAEPTLVANCHCRDCQKATGSPFTTVLAIPVAAFELLSGQPASHTVTAASGRAVTRQFCPVCGTPLFTRAEMLPESIFIKCTTLDEPSAVAPTTNFWTASAIPWAKLDDALHAFAGNPPE